MRRHHRAAPLAVLLSTLFLLAPIEASAQAPTMDPKIAVSGTQFRVEYSAQFEQATLSVSRVGQPEVWTEVFAQSSTISGDLAVLMGGAVFDGFYKYEIEFTWPGAAEPQTVSGGFNVRGGQIVSPTTKRKSPAASGPTPQADLFVSGELRVSGAACLGCPADGIIIAGKLRIFDQGFGNSGTQYGLDGSTVLWTVGNESTTFAITRGGLGVGTRVVGIEQNAPTSSLFIDNTGEVGMGTSTPAGELHIVKSNNNADLFVERAGTNPSTALLSAQGDSVAFGTLTNDPFLIATNNVTRMTIGAGGGVNVIGDFSASGTKNFVEPHPTDPAKSIYYASMEGPEAGTYVRGSAILVKGVAIVDLPEHFAMVTDEKDLTVQLTPRGEWLQAFVVDVNPRKLVLRERNGKSGRIDYRVEGVRKGYADYQVIRSREEGTK